MGRTRNYYRNCKVCGGHSSEVGYISARGKCQNCGNKLMQAGTAEQRAKRGPIFERWYQEMHLRFEHPRTRPTEDDGLT